MHSVSREFSHHGFFNPDCLDRSNEGDKLSQWDKCYQHPAFRCAEHACHHGRNEVILTYEDRQCVCDWHGCVDQRGHLFSMKAENHCANLWKYISKHRLVDGIQDCIANDDETLADNCSLNQTHRFPCSDIRKKYFSSRMDGSGSLR